MSNHRHHRSLARRASIRSARLVASAAGNMMETLEPRQLLALTGVTLGEFPVIAYDSSGLLNYNAATGVFDVSASVTGIRFAANQPPRRVQSTHGDFQIHARVDNGGNLLGGVNAGDLAFLPSLPQGSPPSPFALPTSYDLTIRTAYDQDGNGSITGAELTPVLLLTGEIYAFGFQDSGGPTDQYDFRFVATGGLLFDMGLFNARDIGITMTSEASNFVGLFDRDISGQSKGSAGPIAPPLASSIAGNVYYDQNNDGTFQGTEQGIPGATITLTGTNDVGQSILLTTTTDANGAYSFTGLRPGTYQLTETQPGTYLDGIDTIGTPGGATANDQFSAIVLPANFNGVNNNFGEILASSIAGNVYYDANNDGTFQGTETGIAGVTVTLTGTDDLGNAISLSTTTDGLGAYFFGGLRPGTYELTETQPGTYLDGIDTIGTPGGATANDQFSAILLPVGFNGVNNNFGEILASSIAGNVYFDANNDGTFQVTEVGIAGVRIDLTGTDDLGNAVALFTFTDGLGAYAFTGLRPGTYQLNESQPGAYLDGLDTVGTPGGTTSNDQFSAIALPVNFNGVNNNFGEILASSIAGNVYYDANNDGTFQGTEVGIGGVTVTLTGTDDLGNSINLVTVTDALGAYLFGNLRPGTYQINESQPAGYLDGLDTVGTPGGATSNDQFAAIALPVNFNGVNNNFGEILASSIAGNVYYDANNDGTFQGTESGIAGVTVTLTGTDDLGNVVNVMTVTNAVGAYAFTNLRPGVYQITETQPGAYLDGIDTIGTPGGSTTNDQFSAIALPVNFNGVNNNFGEILASSIAGNVYYDANNNGIFNGTEVGIGGVTVTLTGTDDLGNAINLVTTTNGSGAYAFTGLRPGTYQLNETQPGAYLDGIDTVGTPGGSTTNDQFAAIALPVNFNGVNNNFGEILASSIAGNVYYDANNNGIFNGTESGIAGVTVRLTGTDDLGNAVNLVTTTNGVGAYAFTGLRPGTYVLTETQPGAYLDGRDTIGTPGGATANDQFSAIVLPAGFNGVNNNFGELLASSIAGNVYLDANNDGTFQGSESGIGGVTVRLTGTDDLGNPINLVTTTNAAGAYSFTGLRPGTYVLTETQPAAYLDGIDTIGTPGGTTTNDQFSNINLPAGFAGVNNNFGERTPPPVLGSIRGTKFLDITGNGRSADDTGFGGVTIYIDANNNGTRDSGERQTVTAANGTYSFDNLAAGNYIIREVVPTNYVRTAPVASDRYVVTLTTGQTVTGIDFANARSCECDDAFISDVYYLINGTTQVTDLRGNTNQGDEVTVYFTILPGAPAAGITLTLVSYTAPGASFDANTASQQEIFEVATGTFEPGTYSLTVHNPDSYFQIDFVCGQAIDQFGPAGSNIFYTPQRRLISADNDGTNPVYDNAGSLSGRVFIDADNDFRFDAGEHGIAGVTIVLTGTDFQGRSVSITKMTDSLGNYSFGNLRPGTYRITETQPAGYQDGGDQVGSLGGNGSTNDRFSNINLGANQTGVNYNFGERSVGTSLVRGDTATIGFWQNRNGQNLILSLNGGANRTNLGNWLASNFPKIWGNQAGSSNNMTNKTNTQVAAHFRAEFALTGGPKLDAQIMAVALATYATSSSLAGGNYAASYGFNVTSSGIGGRAFNVGGAGSAFGVSNNTTRTLRQLLDSANNQAVSGNLWNGNSSLRALANSVFDGINQMGDIM